MRPAHVRLMEKQKPFPEQADCAKEEHDKSWVHITHTNIAAAAAAACNFFAWALI